jgi:phosphatidylinositol alpha-1,6-mannosyltransferase
VRLLLVTPQFGYDELGRPTPGGLLQFSRCLARALASSPRLHSLDVWCQVDAPQSEPDIRAALAPYLRPGLALRVRGFGASRFSLAAAMAESCLNRRFDHVIYALLNQAALSETPGHPPFDLWQVGTESFRRLDSFQQRVMRRADRIFSISTHTTQLAARYTPGLRSGIVVPLCAEPPDPDPPAATCPEPAVLTVGNMHASLMYKGHQQLIAAWPQVVSACPESMLWIVGQGDGVSLLREQAELLPGSAARRILFFGAVAGPTLERMYRSARVFALPSSGEGFGLVFVEAARHGLPSIAGRYDAAREIVLHDRTGVLVEQHPHDLALACIRLLKDPALARRLGEAARRRYEEQYRFEHFRGRVLASMELAS